MREVTTHLTMEEAQLRMRHVKAQVMHDGVGHLRELISWCHTSAVAGHWWHGKTGQDIGLAISPGVYPLSRNVGELLALIHSEVSEALEGARKDKQDEHLPGFTSMEVELADALIRIFDLAGAAAPRLGEAFVEKWIYNQNRADHKIASRMAEGGKQF